MAEHKRRLVLVLYRNLVRVTGDINPKISLRPFLSRHTHPLLVESISTVVDLRRFIRNKFREGTTGNEREERLKEAFQTLRKLHELREELTQSRLAGDDNSSVTATPDLSETKESRGDEWTQQLIDQVTWLPALHDYSPPSFSYPHNSILPLFPLGGPKYSLSRPLPTFSNISDVPIPGMEITLKIFEPRYRQLYSDIITSGVRKFAVPFAHPTIPGKFACLGLLYEIMMVKEVADETNGQIQYLCNHLVTKVIKMNAIVNPHAWKTEETYLKISGEVIEEDLMTTNQLEPLVAIVNKWNDESDHPLVQRLLESVKIDGIWGFVSVWNLYLQQELLDMQIGIAAEVKRRSTKQNDSVSHLEVQAPHRERLLSLHLDTALLVPLLLQLDNEHKTQHLVDIVKTEQKRLQDLAIIN